MTEYLDLQSITVEDAKLLATYGYKWLYAITGDAQIGSTEVDLGNTRTHLGGYRMSMSGLGAYVLLNDGRLLAVGKPLFCTHLRRNRAEELGVCSQLVVSRSRFREIHVLQALHNGRGQDTTKPMPGVDLIETFDPWAYVSRTSVNLYATTNSQVYELHRSQYGHYECLEMFVQRKNAEIAFWLREPPSIIRSMIGYKVWSSGGGKDITMPPFRHLLVSEEPLTARDIRHMLRLSGRHGTRSAKPRNP